MSEYLRDKSNWLPPTFTGTKAAKLFGLEYHSIPVTNNGKIRTRNDNPFTLLFDVTKYNKKRKRNPIRVAGRAYRISKYYYNLIVLVEYDYVARMLGSKYFAIGQEPHRVSPYVWDQEISDSWLTDMMSITPDSDIHPNWLDSFYVKIEGEDGPVDHNRFLEPRGDDESSIQEEESSYCESNPRPPIIVKKRRPESSQTNRKRSRSSSPPRSSKARTSRKLVKEDKSKRKSSRRSPSPELSRRRSDHSKKKSRSPDRKHKSNKRYVSPEPSEELPTDEASNTEESGEIEASDTEENGEIEASDTEAEIEESERLKPPAITDSSIEGSSLDQVTIPDIDNSSIESNIHDNNSEIIELIPAQDIHCELENIPDREMPRESNVESAREVKNEPAEPVEEVAPRPRSVNSSVRPTEVLRESMKLNDKNSKPFRINRTPSQLPSVRVNKNSLESKLNCQVIEKIGFIVTEALVDAIMCDDHIILSGEPGVGKTSLAKYILDHQCLVVERMEDLINYDSSSHIGVIFENINFSDVKNYIIEGLLLERNRIIVTEKGDALIPMGTRFIFTTRMIDGRIFGDAPHLESLYNKFYCMDVNTKVYNDTEELSEPRKLIPYHG